MSDTTQYREGRKFAHLTAGTNVLRATGQTAWLHNIVLNTAGAGTITVYNNGAASGEVLAVITPGASLPAPQGGFNYNVRLDNGCTIVLSVTMDVTVIYE